MRGARTAAVLALLAFSNAQGQTPAEPPAAAVPPSRTLSDRFVAAKSILRFELPTTFHTVHGEVGAWKGEIDVRADDPGRLDGGIVIKAGSLTTFNLRRDAVMQGRVLESIAYPDIVFEAQSYSGDLSKLGSEGSATVNVSGVLEIHGVRRPVEVPVECALIGDHAIVAGAVPVHWRDFGLSDPSRWFSRVGDSMLVVFRLWAAPKDESKR